MLEEDCTVINAAVIEMILPQLIAGRIEVSDDKEAEVADEQGGVEKVGE